MGWSRSQFDSLNDDDQIEALAADYDRQQQIMDYLKPFRDKIRNKEGVDYPSFFALLLAGLE